MTAPPYRRFPPDGPSRRNVKTLIVATALLLIVNVLHQTGIT